MFRTKPLSGKPDSVADIPAHLMNPDVGSPDLMYQPRIAEAYLDHVIEGLTWRKIRPKLLERFQPHEIPKSEATFFRWMVKYPEFGDAYEEARRYSARAMEARALDEADGLTEIGPDVTAQQIRGKAEAMSQWRWSAERRDKNRFGAQQATSGLVSISIETDLNLGGGAVGAERTVYELASKVAEDAEITEIAPPLDPMKPTLPERPVRRKMPNRAKEGGARRPQHKTVARTAQTIGKHKAAAARRAAKAAIEAAKKGSFEND